MKISHTEQGFVEFITVCTKERLTVWLLWQDSIQIHLKTGSVKFWNKQILASMETKSIVLNTLHDSDIIRFRTRMKTISPVRKMSLLGPIISNPVSFSKLLTCCTSTDFYDTISLIQFKLHSNNGYAMWSCFLAQQAQLLILEQKMRLTVAKKISSENDTQKLIFKAQMYTLELWLKISANWTTDITRK